MKRFLIIVFLFPVLLLFWLWYTFVGPGYWAEYKDIKAELEKISELEIKELGYNKDITLEDIWAVLHVKGKGDLTVYGLTRESFEEPKRLGLGAIGGFDIRFTGKQFMEVTNEAGDRESIKSDVSGYAITIIGGAFSEMFPSDIKNVQSLVKNYDGVLEVVSKWPDADNKKYLQSETGNEYNYYTVKTET
ncbi:MAG: hypothetical protein ACJ0K4_11215 [Verrucomicrobiales bacterium]|nr:MAG: hypothetical protein EVB09_01715 [Verrucomicrobiaceae bacterium]